MTKLILLFSLVLAAVIVEMHKTDQSPNNTLDKKTRTKRQAPDPLSGAIAIREASRNYAQVAIYVAEGKYEQALKVYLEGFWGGGGMLISWFFGLKSEEQLWNLEVRRHLQALRSDVQKILGEFSGLKNTVQLILSEFDRVVDQVALKAKIQELYRNEKDVILFADSVNEYIKFPEARKHKFLSDCTHLDMNHRFNFFYQETTSLHEDSLIGMLLGQLNLPLYNSIMLRAITAAEFSGLYYISCLAADESINQKRFQVEADEETAKTISSRQEEMKAKISDGVKYIRTNFFDQMIQDANKIAVTNQKGDLRWLATNLDQHFRKKYYFAPYVVISEKALYKDQFVLKAGNKNHTAIIDERMYILAIVPNNTVANAATIWNSLQRCQDRVAITIDNELGSVALGFPGKVVKRAAELFEDCMGYAFSLLFLTYKKGPVPPYEFTVRDENIRSINFALDRDLGGGHFNLTYSVLLVL